MLRTFSGMDAVFGPSPNVTRIKISAMTAD